MGMERSFRAVIKGGREEGGREGVGANVEEADAACGIYAVAAVAGSPFGQTSPANGDLALCAPKGMCPL